MSATILFNREKTAEERETIVKEFIKGCEDVHLPSLKKLLMDKSNFCSNGLSEFTATLDTFINALKSKQIKQLIAHKSFCDLSFFHEGIAAFTNPEGIGQFSLLFNVEDGIAKDITICEYYIG